MVERLLNFPLSLVRAIGLNLERQETDKLAVELSRLVEWADPNRKATLAASHLNCMQVCVNVQCLLALVQATLHHRATATLTRSGHYFLASHPLPNAIGILSNWTISLLAFTTECPQTFFVAYGSCQSVRSTPIDRLGCLVRQQQIVN